MEKQINYLDEEVIQIKKEEGKFAEELNKREISTVPIQLGRGRDFGIGGPQH